MLDASYFPFFCASFQRIPAALNIYRQRNFCTFCHRPHYKSLPFSSNPVLLYSLAPQHVYYSYEVQKKSIPNIIGPPHSLCCLITFTLYSWANTHTFPHEKSGNDRYKRQKKVTRLTSGFGTKARPGMVKQFLTVQRYCAMTERRLRWWLPLLAVNL